MHTHIAHRTVKRNGNRVQYQIVQTGERTFKATVFFPIDPTAAAQVTSQTFTRNTLAKAEKVGKSAAARVASWN